MRPRTSSISARYFFVVVSTTWNFNSKSAVSFFMSCRGSVMLLAKELWSRTPPRLMQLLICLLLLVQLISFASWGWSPIWTNSARIWPVSLDLFGRYLRLMLLGFGRSLNKLLWRTWSVLCRLFRCYVFLIRLFQWSCLSTHPPLALVPSYFKRANRSRIRRLPSPRRRNATFKLRRSCWPSSLAYCDSDNTFMASRWSLTPTTSH